eukprot:3610842-Prymnesium_polylepis.1
MQRASASSGTLYFGSLVFSVLIENTDSRGTRSPADANVPQQGACAVLSRRRGHNTHEPTRSINTIERPRCWQAARVDVTASIEVPSDVHRPMVASPSRGRPPLVR